MFIAFGFFKINMKLKIKPKFYSNEAGHCVVYAIANLLHTSDNAANALELFPSKKCGYAVSEMCEIVNSITEDKDTVPILLCYHPGRFINEDDFSQLYPFRSIKDEEIILLINKSLYCLLIFNIMSKSVKHTIACYYEVNTGVLILMDSAGSGNVWAMSQCDFFNSFNCYGVSMIMSSVKDSWYPVFVEKKDLDIWQK